MATNYTRDNLHSIDDTYFYALLEEEGIREGDEFADDAMYSEALQFQEVLMGSVLMSQVKPSPDQEVADLGVGDPSMSFCGICMERKEKTEMFEGSRCDQDIADHGVGDPSMSFCGICMERKQKMEMFEGSRCDQDVADHGVGDPSMSCCGICMERKEKTEMFEGSRCAHSYCSDCMTKHVVAKLDGNVARVGCPALGCAVVLELEACRQILPKRVVDDWSELLCHELFDVSQRFYCPYKDCSAMMITDEAGGEASSIADADCPFCHRLFCARCSVPWHDGLECDEFQQLGADEKGREDVMVMRLAQDNKWSRCPKCRFYVERTQGCPHMVCRCKFEFCYGCGSNWSGDHSGCARV